MSLEFTIPRTMTAIDIREPGGPDVLIPVQRPVPVPRNDEVLIQVHAAGVNGPDVFQRKGLYDPPPGASDIPGLEVAGVVVATGQAVANLRPGDTVAALVTGGGYAEYAVAHEKLAFRLPEGLDMAEAAALPETFMTVWLNMFERGQFKSGDSILIHGGASGIGTTATMLARHFGASKIVTTVGSSEQRAVSLELGADIAVNFNDEDFVEIAKAATDGRGIDVVLDIIAGDYVARNYDVAAMNGRIVQISVIKGPAKDLDFWPMLRKRLTHIGSTLRSRTNDEKASILADLETHVWPPIRQGILKPYVYRTFALEDAKGAHELLDSGKHIGKIVLVTPASNGRPSSR